MLACTSDLIDIHPQGRDGLNACMYYQNAHILEIWIDIKNNNDAIPALKQYVKSIHRKKEGI